MGNSEVMRLLTCLLICTFAICALGQAGNGENQGRLSAIVQLQRDSVGANLVRISILDPQYPPTELKSQVEKIGANAGSGSRGLQTTYDPIDPGTPSSGRLLRATFAVDGLIDRNGAWLRIAPIVKALAGSPAPHQLENIQIDFDYEYPTERDLINFSSASTDVSRRIVDRTLEYTVHLKTQDPSKIDLPDFAAPAPKNGGATSATKPDWLIIATVGIAVVAMGALVYCLFLSNPFYRKKYRS